MRKPLPRHKPNPNMTPAEALASLDEDMHLAHDPLDNPFDEPPKRKRGRTGVSAGALAALDLNRAGTQIGGPNARTCKHCRRLAVRGLKVCYFHGGRETVVARKKAKGEFIGSKSAMARSKVRRLVRDGLLPMEFTQQPVYRRAMSEFRGKPDYTAAGIKRRQALSLFVWELAKAWLAMQTTGDAAGWASVLTKARQLHLL